MFFSLLGPGLVYAGAAVGVSHLVQSTRAGAAYGLGMIVFALVANLLKFPFFQYGPKYAAITGKNLIHGYSEIGKWAVFLFVLVSVGSMFTVQAAVTVVTAGILNAITGISFTMLEGSTLVLGFCLALLITGSYRLLDRVMTYVIILLSVTTFTAVLIAITYYQPETAIASNSFDFFNPIDLAFLIAFTGWMPAPIEISVWHSSWTVEKMKQKGYTLKRTMLDFNIGYWGTSVLAVCFVTLGALLFYGKPIAISSKGAVFADQLVSMYTSVIGSWSKPLILIAAFTTMFSTTLTVLDGYSRVLKPVLSPLLRLEERKVYQLLLLLTCLGALVILWKYVGNMGSMVQVATVLSFIAAPILASLNLMAMRSNSIPNEHRPGLFNSGLAIIGLIAMVVLAFYYLWI